VAKPEARPSPATQDVSYVETSALLAALLEGDQAARRSLRSARLLATSALTFAEAKRGVLRARLDHRLTAQQERSALCALSQFRHRCFVMAVTEDVLSRGGTTVSRRTGAHPRRDSSCERGSARR